MSSQKRPYPFAGEHQHDVPNDGFVWQWPHGPHRIADQHFATEYNAFLPDDHDTANYFAQNIDLNTAYQYTYSQPGHWPTDNPVVDVVDTPVSEVEQNVCFGSVCYPKNASTQTMAVCSHCTPFADTRYESTVETATSSSS
jgi:hypothetical protein